MNDDGREIGLDDFIGKNIVFRYKKPVQIYNRNGYFPERYTVVEALKDIGIYTGIYFDERTQKKALELVKNDSEVFFVYFDDNNASDLDTDYIRKQYFSQETDSQGWFGGALDGNLKDLPNKIATKISNAAGMNLESVKTGLKTVGVILVAGTIGFAYLYWKMHQTNVNIEIRGNYFKYKNKWFEMYDNGEYFD